jgi:hypothetical protein
MPVLFKSLLAPTAEPIFPLPSNVFSSAFNQASNLPKPFPKLFSKSIPLSTIALPLGKQQNAVSDSQA